MDSIQLFMLQDSIIIISKSICAEKIGLFAVSSYCLYVYKADQIVFSTKYKTKQLLVSGPNLPLSSTFFSLPRSEQ